MWRTRGQRETPKRWNAYLIFLDVSDLLGFVPVLGEGRGGLTHHRGAAQLIGSRGKWLTTWSGGALAGPGGRGQPPLLEAEIATKLLGVGKWGRTNYIQAYPKVWGRLEVTSPKVFPPKKFFKTSDLELPFFVRKRLTHFKFWNTSWAIFSARLKCACLWRNSL